MTSPLLVRAKSFAVGLCVSTLWGKRCLALLSSSAAAAVALLLLVADTSVEHRLGFNIGSAAAAATAL